MKCWSTEVHGSFAIDFTGAVGPPWCFISFLDNTVNSLTKLQSGNMLKALLVMSYVAVGGN